jgi:hypothetical protein
MFGRCLCTEVASRKELYLHRAAQHNRIESRIRAWFATAISVFDRLKTVKPRVFLENVLAAHLCSQCKQKNVGPIRPLLYF